MKIIKHQLKGLIYLDTCNLDLKLASSKQIDLINDSIFLDLSQCQFAELGALTKLLLIIEGYLKSSHVIYLALPTIEHTASEAKSSNLNDKEKLKDYLLVHRQGANNFMKVSGFVSAAQDIASKYNSEIFITETYEFEKKGFNEESFKSSFSVIFEPYLINDKGYKFLLPFKWIDCTKELDDIGDFVELEDKIDRILSNQHRGLDSVDVKGIRNVILSELIKNVREHSESKYAIFTVGLISSARLFSKDRNRKANPIEESYITWIEDNDINAQVELYFGDAGIGLLNKKYEEYSKFSTNIQDLSKQKQLEFAFSKWSTLKHNELRRGTKGLYRLLRIVNKYNGLVHIDTSNSNGGFSRNQPIFRTSEYTFQGTLINVKLNPYKEIKSVKYQSEDNQHTKKWSSNKYKLDLDLKCQSNIKKDIRDNDNLLIILDANDLDFGLENSQKALENLLYEISFDANPTGVVIYLISPIGSITTSIIVDSVQSRILETVGHAIIPEINDENFEEIHDPVFVLGNNNDAFWYGGSNELISILKESYNTGASIHELGCYTTLNEEKQAQLELYLKSYDSDLIRLNSKNEIVFNFRDIEKYYEQTITKALLDSQEAKRCSPKVYIVDKWIDIKEMLSKSEYGFALCLYIKYRAELEKNGVKIENLDKDNTFILIDHGLQYELARKFSELLGIKIKNIRNIDSDIDTSIPKRTKLFHKKARVIFLTTIIASSETTRRLVKYAKRDFASPEFILCLGNFRKYNINSLETWSETTQILSCYQNYNDEGLKEERNLEYFRQKHADLNSSAVIINPDLTTEAIRSEHPQTYIEIDNQLMLFLTRNKLLHYNHYGFYNKRHFTFFLNKIGILNTESFIWDKVIESFKTWMTDKKITKPNIYVNKSVLGENSHFFKMLKNVFENVTAFDSSIKYINSENVIYFDFGILTGESVNELISRCYGVENLFVCLLFNQSVNSNTDLFKRIETIKPQSQVLNNNVKATKFHIEYLFHLPLSFFTSENCPICEHRRALDHFKIDHEYLFEFSEERQERLKQNAFDDIYEVAYPVDFNYSSEEPDQELSSTIIMQMYEHKILLENAKKFTRSRIELYNIIFELWTNQEEEIENADSRIFSLLYYLSHEINWFQQEPLIFRDFRIMVSQIALKLATTPIGHLVSAFEISNKYNIKNKELAIRYKYAAISILRSTDKLVFCQSLHGIASSSVYKDVCVSNLLQNMLYHISSFYKNSYNKSELYYIEIASNLNSVLKEVPLSDRQRSAINGIMSENEKIRRAFVSVSEEPANFKEMKDKWETIYNKQMPAHPEPYEEFKQINLEKYKPLFLAWKDQSLSEEDAKILARKQKHIYPSWESLKSYIENNVMYYFRNGLHNLKNSAHYSNQYENFLNPQVYDEHVKFFDDVLRTAENNWDSYLDKQEDYDSKLNYFQDCFIKKNNLSNFEGDSHILHLLSDFPSDVTKIVKEIFTENDFEKRQFILKNRGELSITDEGYSAYFPISLLKIHLRLIYENVRKRLNKGVHSSDVDLKFIFSIDEKDVLQLDIVYDSTDQYQDEPKSTGSLNAFKSHLANFGGDLSYNLPNDDDKNFSINIKFLRYE